MSLNLCKFVHDKVQEKKLRKLAKKCGTAPENLPTILQNPDIVTLVLKYLKIKDTDDEMPALLFDWNQAGFNDTKVTHHRNGIMGQTQRAIIANILAYGATNFMNLNILFIFRNGQAIEAWYRNIDVDLFWAKRQVGVPDICNNILRLNRITAHTTYVDIVDFLEKVNSEIKQRNRDKKLRDQCLSLVSHKKKGTDKLWQELFNTSLELSSQDHSISKNIKSGQIEFLRRPVPKNSRAWMVLRSLCDTAIGAEDRASKANQEEIMCWSLYGRDFEFLVGEMSSKNKIGEKK
ncbi:8514_t:CDS:2, partial [Acaulospora morrowiae]